ncbi:MAG TPA: alanine racemase [Bryobacteraceae bacterium]|nr:alanine racemase [Bryobacteraceae bacterium]
MTPAEPYRIADVETLLTPALAIYPEIVDRNIAATIRLLGGDANRWRPHLKTAKLGFIMRRMVECGIAQAKCSTTVELAAACAAGMKDVLLAYPVVGANAARVAELAAENRSARISVLVENSRQAASWKGRSVGLFIDLNPGMDRTGMEQGDLAAIVALVRDINAAGIEFRGLHYYDGHVTAPAMEERETAAHRNYERLMEIVTAVERAGFPVGEVITSGTPAFPCAANYAPFRSGRFVHRASPGTVIYSDMSSLTQLPAEWGYQPAAVVVSTVVSHPKANYLTCDAGHKAVSADAGVPTCAVAGRPDLVPLKPSEEHLPMEVTGGVRPEIGEALYLIPRHVCPTVNNFDDALIVAGQRPAAIEKVTARGHEAPLPIRRTQRA